jgi:DNA mismatch endonuclease (patch repair protein)
VQHPDLPGRPDFYLPGLKLVAFSDGCFWHSCPKHGHIPSDNYIYWRPKLERNQKRDRQVTRDLRKQGLIVVRVWEHDLKRSQENVSRRLMRAATAA